MASETKTTSTKVSPYGASVPKNKNNVGTPHIIDEEEEDYREGENTNG